MTIKIEEAIKRTKKNKIERVKRKTAEERAQFLRKENEKISSSMRPEPAKLKIIPKPSKSSKKEITRKWYQKMPIKIGVGLGIAFLLFKFLNGRRKNEA